MQAKIAELGRRIADLGPEPDPDAVKRAALLSAELVRDLRLPETLLGPLRAAKLVGSTYGGLANKTTTHAPLAAGAALRLRAQEKLARRKFPDAYRAQKKTLLPKLTKPLPKVWAHPVSDMPGRPGPGTFTTDVALEALPTLPLHECLHRLLFARAPADEANWAADPLLEREHLKWPAEDHDPLVRALLGRTEKLPESLSREALDAPVWRVGSARILPAMLEELIDAADKDGNVELSRLFTHYHREPLPPRHRIVEELARALQSPVDGPDSPIADRLDPIATGNVSFKRALPLCESYHELGAIIGGLEKRFPTLVSSYLAEHFRCPPTLPALEIAASGVSSTCFEDSVVLCAQHLLPSQVPMFDKLVEHGAKPSDVIVAGVPYSTNALTAKLLEMRGISIVPAEEVDTSLLGRYEVARKQELENAVAKAVERALTSGKKLVVLDDGGIVNQLLHEKFPNVLKQTRIVEQTTRGLTEASRLDLKCPVVNVAKSEGKIEEAPFIAEDLMRGLAKLLPEAGINSLSDVPITIVGFGTIGEGLATLCAKAGMKVSIAEMDPAKRLAAEAAGYAASGDVAAAAKDAKIVIGCTGKRSLPREVIDKLPDGVLLASGSSAEIEIDIEHLLHKAPMRHRVAVQPYWLGDKKILLANGGRPVNFDNARDIDAEKIQLTRSLMFRGAVQAAEMDRGAPRALVPLAKTGQAEVLSYLRAEVWPKLTTEITIPEAAPRDETLWKELEEAYAKGKDLFDVFDANGGDTLVWLRALERAAPGALLPASRLDSTSAKMRRRDGFVRRENVPTILTDPNGRLFMSEAGDNLVPPLIRLPLENVKPVRLQRVSPMVRHEGGKTTADYVLWADDASGKRTAHRIRVSYDQIPTDPKTLRPIRYGHDVPSPKLEAQLLGSHGSASVVGETYGVDANGRTQRGLVLSTDRGIVRLEPDGTAKRTTGESWHGPLRFRAADRTLECFHDSRFDRTSRTLLPFELRSVVLPGNVVAIEDSASAFRESESADLWPELRDEKGHFASTVVVARLADGSRAAFSIDWGLPGKAPALSSPVGLPEGQALRHFEPIWQGEAPNRRVAWQLEAHESGTLDEPSFWKELLIASPSR